MNSIEDLARLVDDPRFTGLQLLQRVAPATGTVDSGDPEDLDRHA